MESLAAGQWGQYHEQEYADRGEDDRRGEDADEEETQEEEEEAMAEDETGPVVGDSKPTKKGGQPYKRVPKEKTLLQLTESFVRAYGAGGTTSVHADEAVRRLNSERRRVQDVMTVLEALQIVSRKAKRCYDWKGFDHLPLFLDNLLSQAQEGGLQIDAHVFRAPGEKGGEREKGDAEQRRTNEFARKLAGLYLASGVVALEDAVAQLYEFRGDAGLRRNMVKRLWDVATVLCGLGLMEKVNKSGVRKPAFRWLGEPHVAAARVSARAHGHEFRDHGGSPHVSRGMMQAGKATGARGSSGGESTDRGRHLAASDRLGGGGWEGEARDERMAGASGTADGAAGEAPGSPGPQSAGMGGPRSMASGGVRHLRKAGSVGADVVHSDGYSYYRALRKKFRILDEEKEAMLKELEEVEEEIQEQEALKYGLLDKLVVFEGLEPEDYPSFTPSSKRSKLEEE